MRKYTLVALMLLAVAAMQLSACSNTGASGRDGGYLRANIFKPALSREEWTVHLYHQVAFAWLQRGDGLEALEFLQKGAEITGDFGLAERAAYVGDHLVIVKETCYRAGELEKVEEYDTAGHWISQTFYYKGEIRNTSEAEYDASGNLIRASYTSPDTWTSLSYDAFGNRVEEVEHGKNDEVTGRREFEYDSAGNRVTARHYYYYTEGVREVLFWDAYEYDAADRLIREVSYSGEGREYVIDAQEYEYDAAGQLIKEIRYGWQWELDCREEYEYDDSGNRILWRHYEYKTYEDDIMDTDDGVLTFWYEYIYDDGNKIMMKPYLRSDGACSVGWWYEWEYDDAGREIKAIYYNPDGTVFSICEKQYDAAGNCIRISYDSGFREDYVYEYEYIGN